MSHVTNRRSVNLLQVTPPASLCARRSPSALIARPIMPRIQLERGGSATQRLDKPGVSQGLKL